MLPLVHNTPSQSIHYRMIPRHLQSNAPRLAAEGAVRAIMRLSLESIPTIR